MDCSRERRLKKLRKKMEELKLDAFLVSKRENLFYLSGFTGDSGYLAITPEKKWMLLDSRFTEQAKEETNDWELLQFKDFPVSISQLWKKLKVRYVGFESHNLSCEDFKRLEKEGSLSTYVACPWLVEWVRAKKEAVELARIRHSIHIAEEALAEVLRNGLRGKKETELSLALEYSMRVRGAMKPGFDLIVASGTRSALPHGIASSKKIEKGEIVLFDWGAQDSWYISDITRCFFTGRPTSRQKAIYQVVQDVQEEVISSLRAGKEARDVYQKAVNLIKETPFRTFGFQHGLGHGIGLEVHEQPLLNSHSTHILEDGEVITIEPGIYIPGWGGVRLEDIVLIKKNGCEVLSSFPKEIWIV